MSSIRTCGLFEGIGGFCEAARRVRGFDWQCSVEIDDDAVQVLRSQFDHPIYHGDIRNFRPRPGQYDLIVGGFPCTGTSNAGLRNGLEHPQSGAMFREFLRVVGECQPSLILLEQPSGFIDRGLRAWIGALRMGGYQSLDPLITRCDQLGAQFERERVFVLSYSYGWTRGKTPGCWVNRVREVVEETRNTENWLTVERTSDRLCARIPQQLVQGDFTEISVPTRHPGRLTARKLGGQTVTVPQAAVALEWVKWLWAS